MEFKNNIIPLAVAIISSTNHPILLKTSFDNHDKEEATKLIYLMHATLDIVDEKIDQPTSRDNFLGILHQCEQFKLYGYISTTKVKVFVIISNRFCTNPPRDIDVKSILKNIHKNYIEASAMNPFYKTNETIQSKRLNSYLDTIFLSAVDETVTVSGPSQSPAPALNQIVQTV